MKKAKPGSGKTRKAASSPVHPPHSSKLPQIPSILLEDDDVEHSDPSFSEPPSHKSSGAAQMARLMVLPRDPHNIYAHWEILSQKEPASESLILRVHQAETTAVLVAQIPIAQSVSHAFIHVPNAGAKYVAELGSIDSSGRWFAMATSTPISTPPDSVSDDKTAWFAEMPPLGRKSLMARGPGRQPDRETVMKSAHPNPGETLLVPPPKVSWIPSLSTKEEEAVALSPLNIASLEQADLFADFLKLYAEHAPQPNPDVIGTVPFEITELLRVSGPSSPATAVLPQ